MRLKGFARSAIKFLDRRTKPPGTLCPDLPRSGKGFGLRWDQKTPVDEFIRHHRLCAPESPIRIHLGCGQQRLEGYINVDYPLEHHTVQTKTVADLHSDIRTMDLLHGSVSEVRLHHVLEHFPRVEALALLMRWNRWLCEGGMLIVETPDFGRSVSLLSWPWYSDARRWRVMRHIFGSQEAAWAYHYEGWSKHRFRRVLTKLGYGQLRFELNSWKDTRNITVHAKKLHELSPEKRRSAAEDLLRDYLIDDSDTEQRMLEAWMQQFDRFQSEAKLQSLEPRRSS